MAELFEPAFLAAYFDALRPAIRFTDEDLARQAEAWLAGLPARYQEEIDGMALGAGTDTATAAAFLYADIARPTRPPAAAAAHEAAATGSVTGSAATPAAGAESGPLAGPMCSALIARLGGGATWVGRNCDWLTATLLRGTAAVGHAAPGRIPVLAVGIRGDIDLDTGVNAEGLWLHLHTMHARDAAPDDRPCISWLFWAREALETCATLDQLEAFVASTGRDQGVLAIAAEGRTGEAAVFECSRGAHTRHAFEPSAPMCVTNHSPTKPLADDDRPPANPSGSLARARSLRSRLSAAPPRRGPDDLIAALAADGVEMRTPKHLRTIYAAVADPSAGSIWFAAGSPDGSPASSRGAWSRVEAQWG